MFAPERVLTPLRTLTYNRRLQASLLERQNPLLYQVQPQQRERLPRGNVGQEDYPIRHAFGRDCAGVRSALGSCQFLSLPFPSAEQELTRTSRMTTGQHHHLCRREPPLPHFFGRQDDASVGH